MKSLPGKSIGCPYFFRKVVGSSRINMLSFSTSFFTREFKNVLKFSRYFVDQSVVRSLSCKSFDIYIYIFMWKIGCGFGCSLWLFRFVYILIWLMQ